MNSAFSLPYGEPDVVRAGGQALHPLRAGRRRERGVEARLERALRGGGLGGRSRGAAPGRAAGRRRAEQRGGRTSGRRAVGRRRIGAPFSRRAKGAGIVARGLWHSPRCDEHDTDSGQRRRRGLAEPAPRGVAGHLRHAPPVDADRRQDPAGPTPLVNHWWKVTLYVTPRGLTTSAIPYGGRDLHGGLRLPRRRGAHRTQRRGRGAPARAAARGRLLQRFMAALSRSGSEVKIWPMP